MKRSGFTMIELIFVIVILGILASVAIPKLAATRDDAKVSKALKELVTLKTDLAAYYTAHGTYGTNGINTIQNSTNVILYSDSSCVTKANEIQSEQWHYYCVDDNNNQLEYVLAYQPGDVNGTLWTWVRTARGDIGKAIQSSDAFKSLKARIDFGGSKVKY